MPNYVSFLEWKEFSIMSIRYVMMNWNIMGRECFTLYINPLPIIQRLSTRVISISKILQNHLWSDFLKLLNETHNTIIKIN